MDNKFSSSIKKQKTAPLLMERFLPSPENCNAIRICYWRKFRLQRSIKTDGIYPCLTCTDEESSHLAFSAASRTLWSAMLSLVKSTPVYQVKTHNTGISEVMNYLNCSGKLLTQKRAIPLFKSINYLLPLKLYREKKICSKKANLCLEPEGWTDLTSFSRRIPAQRSS